MGVLGECLGFSLTLHCLPDAGGRGVWEMCKSSWDVEQSRRKAKDEVWGQRAVSGTGLLISFRTLHSGCGPATRQVPPRGSLLSDSDSLLPQAHALTEKEAEAQLKEASSQGLGEPALTLASCSDSVSPPLALGPGVPPSAQDSY